MPNSHCKDEKRVSKEGSAERLDGRLLGWLTRLRHSLLVILLWPHSLKHACDLTFTGPSLELRWL